MKIIVCTKQVPASESRIKVAASGKEADSAELTYVVNPYDEFGVEEAIRIRERLGAGEVTVISVGTSKAAEALRTSLAMGADKAILLSDPVFIGSDSLGIARILAAQIKTMEYDLIFFGKQAIDDDMGAVGIMVAELLALPHVGMINKLEISTDKKSAVAQRQIEGAHEIMEVPLPAVFTCQKGLNE
ncbi:MAG TPA: electron transfer flavoprotein subunit beta/FixA family protein, partial [Nitrospiria bacterium]|nr:electron transfer flavoprotein subunit beta/FixA family protein [Nitrospiria bacterium]